MINKDKKEKPAFYGGQAAMEGVMMRGKKSYALSVRTPSKGIETRLKAINKAERHPFFKLPVIRGMVSFVSSLYLGVKVIYDSADMAGLSDLEEENPSRFEKWLEKKFGDKLFNYLMYFSVFVSICFSIGLFILLPTWISSFINPLIGERKWILGVCEGLLRMAIFIGYLFLVSKMKEIKRVFQYHGAEHKTINCYESGAELTPENVKTFTTRHKRCGTSLLLIVMLVSMVVFFFVRFDNIWLRLLSRLLLIPFVAGISYELIMWAGRSKARIVGIISAPGLWLQSITTYEPDNSQIEVAIAALKAVLVDDGIIVGAGSSRPDTDGPDTDDTGDNA
ncbi:MAG: DUF1385 domain-containing protein [Clostridiales bacterium]|jgi:uncharacterized protein YqhQ|nr:DUF1385 domain-containing protein [Clostridiales bacterium]